MKRLSSNEVMLSSEAAHEWKAMEDSVLLHQAMLCSGDTPVTYRHTELADGTLELAVEVQEQPFPHGMYLRIPSEHWRKVKGDA